MLDIKGLSQVALIEPFDMAQEPLVEMTATLNVVVSTLRQAQDTTLRHGSGTVKAAQIFLS